MREWKSHLLPGYKTKETSGHFYQKLTRPFTLIDNSLICAVKKNSYCNNRAMATLTPAAREIPSFPAPSYGTKGYLPPASISSLDELIAHLRDIFASPEVDIDLVQAVLRSYKSNPADWKKFAKFDEYRYTRNLVDEGNGKYNLMLLCWGEGHGSPIHDHADAHCFMKILQGGLSEVRFEWPEKPEGQVDEDENHSMKETSRCDLSLNGVCYMSDALGLHRVENPSHTQPAVSLHLYSPPFSACSMFDQRTGHETKCKVTFWSKYGEKVNNTSSPPPQPSNGVVSLSAD